MHVNSTLCSLVQWFFCCSCRGDPIMEIASNWELPFQVLVLELNIKSYKIQSLISLNNHITALPIMVDIMLAHCSTCLYGFQLKLQYFHTGAIL